MSSSEKRKYKRLAIKLDLSCRKVGSAAEKVYTGSTVNVSPGGMYFETAAETFESGNLLKVELSIPPTAGLLELGGRISGLAKVVRTAEPDIAAPSSSGEQRVAVEFCQAPKLST